ncbi:MAG: anthranilate synthase component I family protein [Candidatus Thermoplasmatota archaeon]
MILKELKLSLTPAELYSKISAHYNYSFLLESAKGPKRFAQHSFLGFNPIMRIALKGRKLKIEENDGEKEIICAEATPKLRDIIRKYRIKENKFKYTGGLVGYFSYDFIRALEKIPCLHRNELDFPDFELGLFLDGIIYEHLRKRIFYFSHQKDNSAEILSLLARSYNEQGQFKVTKLKLRNIDLNVKSRPKNFLLRRSLTPNIEKDDFESSVELAKDYIYKGRILQVVLSRRLEGCYTGDLFDFYNSLKTLNPSPYMYYLSFGKRKLIGTSPEMLVALRGNTIETYPIAGTRPMGKSKEETEFYRKELLASEKERAEHNMLVDLARNDVGKVAEIGSVKLEECMKVEKYSHVQHIVSKVVGKLNKDKDAFDVFNALFPAGTVTGAPKIEAMKIIESLEPCRRGPYAGAVGYFSLNGNEDFAIAIRTLFANKNKLYLQAGAGIVADSIPENEFYETEHKLGALVKALGVER